MLRACAPLRRRPVNVRHGANELDFLQPLAGRAVEQDRIPFRFPDRRKLNRPRTMQAKQDSAWLTFAEQGMLRHPKRAEYELMLQAEGVSDKVSQIVQIFYTLGSRQHCEMNPVAGHGFWRT
jgi:hypothetical protein